ncbi:retinoid-binding protein 7 [Equus przewalskii]|uniref:Retinoid-binding protein 7 n=1 Tax=Equus przewalskii TaxID=9798 RepID=A0ABM2EQM0_EQUPR|nr:PREDICTED: retinoid-binding protein 7 [Equus przewalskii]
MRSAKGGTLARDSLCHRVAHPFRGSSLYYKLFVVYLKFKESCFCFIFVPTLATLGGRNNLRGGVKKTRHATVGSHQDSSPTGRAAEWDVRARKEEAWKGPGIDFAIHKIAKLLKPQKVIEQNGDSFTIHTSSSLKNYLVKFTVGEEFDEDNKGLDNGKCRSLVTWDNDTLICVQKGEKKNRGWTHWIEGDQLHLEMFYEGQVCKQTFQRA